MSVEPPGGGHLFGTDGTYYGQMTNTGNSNQVYTIDSNKLTKNNKIGGYDFNVEDTQKLTWQSGKDVSYNDLKELAGTVYAEASVGAAEKEEMLGIYNCIENRAGAEKSTVTAIIRDSSQGIYGYGDRNRIDSETSNNALIKRKNAYAAVIEGIRTNTDITNGAFYWDGTDFATTGRYSHSYLFTNSSHDIYNVGSKEKYTKGKNGYYSYKYKSTFSSGGTIFSTLTEKYKNTLFINADGTVRKSNWNGSKPL